MVDVHPSLDQSVDCFRPPNFDYYISQAMVSLGINTTSKKLSPDQLDHKAIINRAIVLYTKTRLHTIQFPADAAHFIAMFEDVKPDYEIGRHIKNLQMVGCSGYLTESSDLFGALSLVKEHALSLRLLYIGSKGDYINLTALSIQLQPQLELLMQRIQVLVLERVKDIPLSLFCSLGKLQVLDLAVVQLPASSAAPVVIMPGIRRMAVHDVFSGIGTEQEGSETLNSVATLMQSSPVFINGLTTLYLDYLGCKGCSSVWRDVIERCRDTIQYLKLYCGDGTEMIDLGVLPKIRLLHLFVAANSCSIEFLCQLLKSLNMPGKTLSELKLAVDARETSDWDWTDNVISRNAESWKTVDETVAQILEFKAKGVQFILSVPEMRQTEREAGQKVLVEQFTKSRRWLQLPIRFVAEGDSLTDVNLSFSLVQEEITSFT